MRSDIVPIRLEFLFGVARDLTSVIEWACPDVVIKFATPPSVPTVFGRVRPTDQQWADFRSSMDAIGVWRWQPRYVCADVLDGASWSLTLEYADRLVDSVGVNLYPGADGAPGDPAEDTEEFRAMIEGLRQLTNGFDTTWYFNPF